MHVGKYRNLIMLRSVKDEVQEDGSLSEGGDRREVGLELSTINHSSKKLFSGHGSKLSAQLVRGRSPEATPHKFIHFDP